MARIIKPKETHHALRVRSDLNDGELLIIGGGKRRTYLWVGNDDGAKTIMTFSGRATLRKLALEILRITE